MKHMPGRLLWTFPGRLHFQGSLYPGGAIIHSTNLVNLRWNSHFTMYTHVHTHRYHRQKCTGILENWRAKTVRGVSRGNNLRTHNFWKIICNWFQRSELFSKNLPKLPKISFLILHCFSLLQPFLLSYLLSLAHPNSSTLCYFRSNFATIPHPLVSPWLRS